MNKNSYKMCEELRDRGIPNIIEKKLLNMIATEKEISLSIILEKLLEKYVKEGVIFKKELE